MFFRVRCRRTIIKEHEVLFFSTSFVVFVLFTLFLLCAHYALVLLLAVLVLLIHVGATISCVFVVVTCWCCYAIDSCWFYCFTHDVAYHIGVVISCWCCQSKEPCSLDLVFALLTLVLFLFSCLIWYFPPSYLIVYRSELGNQIILQT